MAKFCSKNKTLRLVSRSSLRTPRVDKRSAAVLLAFVVLLSISGTGLSQQPRARSTASHPRSLTISTKPNAIVWLDEVRRGVTDASGKLRLTKVSPGRHLLRARANGFKEVTMPLVARQSGSVLVRLTKTTDQAELSFQQAETVREQAKDDESRHQAANLYRQALELRPAYSAAHVGLARVLMDSNEYDAGLAEIETARRARPVYPEASAVEGRIYREKAYSEEAIQSFRRAVREARGFQPEAHVGLARVFEDKGQYEEAAAEYRKAIEQLADSEPVIYQLLGAAYERAQKYKEAIAAYENYLELAPNGSLAPAVRSIIDQLKGEAGGQELIP
jgi:lipopolysaccharide biosynthesis regulator YciM